MYRPFAALAAVICIFFTKSAAQESAFIEIATHYWLIEATDWPRLDSIGNPDSLAEDQLRLWAARLDQQAGLLKKGFERELQYATYKRQNLHDQVAKVKREKTASDSIVVFQTNQYLQAKQAERDWKKLAERAKKTVKSTARFENMPVAGLRRAILTNESDIRGLIAQGNEITGNRPKPTGPVVARPTYPVAENPVAPTGPKIGAPFESKPPAARPKANRTASDFKLYSRADDPLFTPPAPKCRIAGESRDEFTGQVRVEMAAEPFFTFTNSFMKNHLRDRPHIDCAVQLMGIVSGPKYVNLTIKINEGSAKRSFGGLNRGNRMTIKFIDGSVITLENARTDEGAVNETDNFTTFQGIFLIDGKEQLSAIKKREIDRIRIAWNTGFEDYEVYNVDVLRRQASCIF